LRLGDSSHLEGYRDLIERYGAQLSFAEAVKVKEVEKYLEANYDSIFFVTSYASHSSSDLIKKKQGNALVDYMKSAGIGEMKRALESEVFPYTF